MPNFDIDIGIFPVQNGQNKVSDFFERLKIFKISLLQIGQNRVFDIFGSLKWIKTGFLALFHLLFYFWIFYTFELSKFGT